MVQQSSRTACSQTHRISKGTVIASFPEDSPTREWLESLDDESWTVTSFAPETRQVCIETIRPGGTSYVTLTLPMISTSQVR